MGDSPGPAAAGPPDHARQRLESEFLLALRRAGAVMQLLGAASAERIGINVTDLNCLNILALSGQLTAGELARATGLTTASITGVLDRLEEAGFVRRERDAHDRRRVVVHLDATRGLRDVAPVFAPVVEAWRAAAAQYSDQELTLILGFQSTLEQIMRDRLVELRDSAGLGKTGAMSSDETPVGHGPDDMGDDEQEFELAEYKQYIEDPPESLDIEEDDDDDAEEAQDWSDRHPRQVIKDDDDDDSGDDDEPAEEAAVHVIPDS